MFLDVSNLFGRCNVIVTKCYKNLKDGHIQKTVDVHVKDKLQRKNNTHTTVCRHQYWTQMDKVTQTETNGVGKSWQEMQFCEQHRLRDQHEKNTDMDFRRRHNQIPTDHFKQSSGTLMAG